MPNKKILICSADDLSSKVNCVYEDISVCPICHHALIPKPLNGYYVSEQNHASVYMLFLCPNCRNIFLVKYGCSRVHMSNIETIFVKGIYPSTPESIALSKDISNLSPMFVTTYNQSIAAEAQQLTEIAGCGFRKALEYLIKDYLCHKVPEESEIIKSEFLGNAIKRINDERIKTLAERAVWIGNDETHYIRKHDNLDLSNMKQFVLAMLHYVEAELTLEKALSVLPKK